MSLLTRYRALLRGTGAAQPLAASLVGRLAMGMLALALLLTTRESTGSYAAAGLVAAAYAVAFAVGAPLRARRADRAGPRGVLLACGVLHPAVLAVLVLLAEVRAGTAALVAAALVAGATVPPLGGVMRALWGRLVPEEALPTAFSLESVVVETCFVAGPLLVGAVAVLAGPSASVLVCAVLVLAGSLWLAGTPALRAVLPHAAVAGAAGPLAAPSVRALLAVVACVGTGFGAVDVAVPAFVEHHGSRPALAGVLLALWSAGSIAGGLTYGAVHPRGSQARQLPVLVAGLAALAVLPLLAPGTAALGAALALYGVGVAPFLTCASVLLGRAAPPGTSTEAFSWSSSMIFGGAALGNAACGWLVDRVSVTSGFGLTAAATVLGLGLAVRARSVLLAAERPAVAVTG